MKIINGGVCAAKGFLANGIHCGIRKNRTKRDLALIYSETLANAAAVYTTNLVKGAPLTVTKAHISDGHAQAVICNSGNANTCNANGIEVAEKMSEAIAKELNITLPDGKAVSFGQTLYWGCPEMPELKGLKVLRPGLELGTLKKDRFEPAHALALWLKNCKNTVSFAFDSQGLSPRRRGACRDQRLVCGTGGWLQYRLGQE